MTHRERLQKSINKLQEVYDEIGYLRDHATPAMQQQYNEVRKFLPVIWSHLQKVDNNIMPDEIAKQKL